MDISVFFYLYFLLIPILSYSILKNDEEKTYTRIFVCSLVQAIIATLFLRTLPYSDLLRYDDHFTHNYLYFYESLNRFFRAPVEPGFLFFTYLIHQFTTKSFYFYFIISVFYLFSFNSFLILQTRNMGNKEKGYIVFLLHVNFAFFYNLYLLKQSVSVSFFFISLLFFDKKEYKKGLFFYLFSLLSHRAALITLPYIMLYYHDGIRNFIFKKIKITQMYFLFSILLLILSIYRGEIYFNVTKYLYIIFMFMILLMNIGSGKNKSLLADRENLGLIFSGFLLTGSMAYYWSHRFAWYFLPSTIIFIVDNCFLTESKKQDIVRIFLIAFQLLLFIRQINVSLVW